MGMLQTDCTRFVDELLQVFLAGEPCLQDFDGDRSVFADVLSKIDIAKASSPKPAEQAIVPNLLSHPIYMSCHQNVPLRDYKVYQPVRANGIVE